MPIFEYQCKKCGRKFETLVFSYRGEKNENVTCPSCGNTNCSRLISLCFSSTRGSGHSLGSIGSQCGTGRSGIG